MAVYVVARSSAWLGDVTPRLWTRIDGHLLRANHNKRLPHFFYGDAPGVAEDLASRFVSRFSGVAVAGTYSPPFRTLSPEEDREVVAAINGLQADIVWVGLSTPKQERWMFGHRDRLNVPV